MIFYEKTLETETVFNGKLINVRVDKVTVPTGESTREIVEHPNGVVIVALLPNGNVIMERQFRKPVDDMVFELPAGKIDPGEDPKVAALRELREETGYVAKEIKLLTESWPSVGFSDEILYIYLAKDLQLGDRDLDENEVIDLEEYSIDDLYNMVMDGKIIDAKSQIGILMTKSLIDKGKLNDYLLRSEKNGN